MHFWKFAERSEAVEFFVSVTQRAPRLRASFTYSSFHRLSIRTKLPSQEEILSAAKQCGFLVRDHKIVDHIFADSGEEYLDKISHRACSDLVAVPDDEFRCGLGNLKEALSHRNEKGPITEPIDLFVLQAVSAGA